MAATNRFDQISLIDGEVIATNITYEAFLKQFDGQHVEWVNGVVIQMSPVSKRHNALSVFFITFFNAFLGRTTGGQVLHDPMTMKANADLPGRMPDIQVLLPNNLAILKDNEVAGAADLVIEIVSPDSDRRDRIEKFQEYERGGVKEYWIVDSITREALFYCRDENGIFRRRLPDEQGIYHSMVLSRLAIPVDLFWRDPLPDFWEIARLIEAMLKEA